MDDRRHLLAAILLFGAACFAVAGQAVGQDPFGPRDIRGEPREETGPRSRSEGPSDRGERSEARDDDTKGEDEDDKEEDEEDEEDEEEEDEEEDESPPPLLGERWHTLGPLSGEYQYIGEVFNNAHGGISTRSATRYRGNLDVVLKFDTEAAQWWKGGQGFLYLQHSHGETLSQDFVGDGQFYSNIDTGPKPQDLTQLGEYWFQQSFEDGPSVKLGRQDANADFAFADLGADFLNSSFVTLPNIPMPFWPFQTLGVSSLWQCSETVRVGGGVWDSGRDQRHWWVTQSNRGMFFLAQIDYLPRAAEEEALQTLLRLGAWATNSDTLAVVGSHVFEGNYGFYATVDQMLFAETPGETQGLAGFFQFSWAPNDRNQVDRHFGGGLVYRGLLPGRDDDRIGAGFTLIDFAGALERTAGQTYENAVEFFYKAQVRPWLCIQPDVQFIASPSGIYDDALVVGLRFEANL